MISNKVEFPITLERGDSPEKLANLLSNAINDSTAMSAATPLRFASSVQNNTEIMLMIEVAEDFPTNGTSGSLSLDFVPTGRLPSGSMDSDSGVVPGIPPFSGVVLSNKNPAVTYEIIRDQSQLDTLAVTQAQLASANAANVDLTANLSAMQVSFDAATAKVAERNQTIAQMTIEHDVQIKLLLSNREAAMVVNSAKVLRNIALLH